MPKKISDEELLEDLRNVAEELGKSPTQEEYQKHGEYSLATLMKRFTFNEAKEKIGLETYSRGSSKGGSRVRISDEKLIEELNKGKKYKQIAEEYGYKPPARSHLSKRLREAGYTLRSGVTKNNASYGEGHGFLLSVARSVVDRLDLRDKDDLYYELVHVDEENQRITFEFSDKRVVKRKEEGEEDTK